MEWKDGKRHLEQCCKLFCSFFSVITVYSCFWTNRYDLLYTLQLETQMIFEAKESMWQTHQDQNVPWRCWETVENMGCISAKSLVFPKVMRSLVIEACFIMHFSWNNDICTHTTFTLRFFCHELNQMFEFAGDTNWKWLTFYFWIQRLFCQEWRVNRWNLSTQKRTTSEQR